VQAAVVRDAHRLAAAGRAGRAGRCSGSLVLLVSAWQLADTEGFCSAVMSLGGCRDLP